MAHPPTFPSAVGTKRQVRRWGILWKPLEVQLERVSHVVNAVVRCHNFCRSRVVSVPRDNIEVTVPASVQFNDNGTISNDFFEPSPGVGGRNFGNQAAISVPREGIRTRLEFEGIVRPRHNIERNRARLQN